MLSEEQEKKLDEFIFMLDDAGRYLNKACDAFNELEGQLPEIKKLGHDLSNVYAKLYTLVNDVHELYWSIGEDDE